MPFCSIIVPVYKTEDYLERCVNSILNQTMRNFELILVNDGSPDRCPEMCDQFARADTRVQVVHQQNSGVSSARNTGIAKASGKFIWFIDSDDYIGESSLSELFLSVQQKDADLYVFNNKGIHDYFVGSLDELMEKYYFSYVLGFNTWNKLYRTSVLKANDLQFDVEETVGEDLLFNLEYYHSIMRNGKKGSFCFIGRDYYTYNDRPGSTMHTESKNRLSQQLRLFRKAKLLLYEDVSADTLTYLFLLHLISGVNQARYGGLTCKEFSIMNFSSYADEISRTDKVLNKFFHNETASFAGKVRLKIFLQVLNTGNYTIAGKIMGLR